MPRNSADHREISSDPAAQALQLLPTGVQPGALVDVRGTRWRLEQTIARDDCCELHLTSTTDDGRRVLLWPFDRPTAVDSTARFAVVRMRHWLRAIAAAEAHEVGPWTPRATTVRADVLAYQLEPAIAAAQGVQRLVLADEVGLGKTVQAGWIAADLIERERDARILIAVPAGLRRQWEGELNSRFGLRPIAVDAGWLRTTVADLPADVSPWSAPAIYVGSIDFLKRADVADSLRSHLWDLLIVDEAHGSTAPTERHAALEAVASRSRRIVSITATPFSGDAARFSSLVALGSLSPAAPAPMMFRRSREDTGDCRPRRHRFVLVRITQPESRLQRLLERYSREVWHEAAGDANSARLAMTILRKRALSSPAAAERSLRRRLALLQGTATAPRQLSFFEDEDVADDDLMDAALAAPGLADAAREQRWLAAMSEAAAGAANADSKLRRVARLLRRTREAAIVFTEYRDTLRHLATALPGALQLHGGMSATERSAVQQRFNDEGGWLFATDAASEGLNLQHRCRLIINYELPWNPARVEQRIGRVDRIGQSKPVHAITLVARDTAEDLVVARFTRRLARVAAALGKRDRLAAFLDEARIARSVIASDCSEPAELADETEESDGTDVSVLAPPDLHDAAARAAREIQRRVATPRQWTRAPVASAFGRGPLLRPGFVIALRCTAQTIGGSMVSGRLAIIHVPDDSEAPRPPRAGDVRTRATAAFNRLVREKDGAIPQLSEWFDDVQRAHAGAVDLQIARETALLDRRIDTPPVQRGLFDRRALVAADRQSIIDAALQQAARERIARLRYSRLLQLNVTPAGILVLWR
jgi:superfamily II DNA or RNA helicase